MFATDAVAAVIYSVIVQVPEVGALVGDRIIGLPVLPPDVPLPVIMFYPTFSPDNGSYGDLAIGGVIATERVDWTMRVICEGRTTDPVRPVAKAILDALHHHSADIVLDGESRQVSISATGELTQTTVIEGDRYFRQLGNFYRSNVT